jgi:hypothetical protein
VACASLAGCWLTASFSGLGQSTVTEAGAADGSHPPTDGRGDESDGQAGSGSSSGSASSSSGGPQNLLQNPGFEENTGTGCGPDWVANLGNIQTSPVAHSGKYSCMLCPNSSAPGAVFELLYTGTPATGPVGTSLQAGAWFMFAPSDAGPGDGAPTAQLQLGYTYGAGSQQYTGDTPSYVTESWQPATTNLLLDAGNESVQLIVLFAYQPGVMGTGGCVLIDDTSLIAQ